MKGYLNINYTADKIIATFDKQIFIFKIFRDLLFFKIAAFVATSYLLYSFC